MAIAVERSSDLYIDGMLTPGGAGRFPTVNPATEEVMGPAANADAHDMDRAIAAKTVTYDFARQMEGAKEVKCSEFGKEIVKHM